MSKLFLVLWLPAFIQASEKFRVMTFNIWMSAINVDNGLEKVAKHIAHINPDVVALQEVTDGDRQKLESLLRPPWKGIETKWSRHSAVILTKHKIFMESFIFTDFLMGLRVEINNQYSFHIINAHLDYRQYGPYAVYESINNTAQILKREKKRLEGLEEFFKLNETQKWLSMSDKTPVIVCGDFNAPSHLDWQEDTKHQHEGWIVDWPTSKFMEQQQFSDSFRVIHQDANLEPGKSWSTIKKFNKDMKIPEPQDRIDFIYYRGRKLNPTSSFIYGGDHPLKPIPNQRQNDYPSDHYAIVTDFNVKKC